MTTLLALDTATERMHVGLAVNEHVWLHEGEGGAHASTLLIPCVLRLLREAGLTVGDLNSIAFGHGPGSFTGLRTACSVAQGLAFGAAKPVLSVDTLMAVAEDARGRTQVEDVWVTMDARMDEIYAAHYRLANAAWQTVVVPALYTLEAMHARWQAQAPQCVAGTAVVAFGERLHVGAALVVADAVPGARALLALAGAQWAQGMFVDAALALPCYLRDKIALTTQERAAAKAAL